MKLSEQMRHIISGYFRLDGLENGYAKEWADEVAQLEAALTFIGDIAYDHDGYTGDAEKLGKLIDEIYKYARDPKEVLKALGR